METGRPTDYRPEYADEASALAQQGLTDQEIADRFDVSVRTLYRWKKEWPLFCQALKSGKAEADERVERSLFSRATGYEHEEVDIRVVNGEIVKTPIRKHYPPDTVAGIFWLKNRRPDLWRDARELKITKDVKELTDAELLAIASGNGIAPATPGTNKPKELH